LVSPTAVSAYSGGYADTAVGDTNGDGVPDLTWRGDGKIGTTYYRFHTNCKLTGGAPIMDCKQTNLSVNDVRGSNNPVGDYYNTGIAVVTDALTSEQGMHRVNPSGDPQSFVAWGAGQNVDCSQADGAIAGDFNGDGVQDGACYIESTQTWLVTLTGANTFPDQMQTVTDGHGLVTTFNYKGKTDASVYTQGTGTTLPKKDDLSNYSLVWKLSVDADSAVGTGTLDTNYSYTGARRDVSRNAALGFDTVVATDATTGVVTTTNYSQNFPYIGQVTQSVSKVTVAGVQRTIRQQVNTLVNFATAGSTVLYPYVRYSKITGTDLDGSILPTHESQVGDSHSTDPTDGIDGGGNILSLTETITDGADVFTAATANTYSNDWTNWHIGLLTDTQVTRSAPNVANVMREVKLSYDGFSQLYTKTVEPYNAGLKKVTTYTRDSKVGVITMETEAWTDPLTSQAVSRDVVTNTFTDPDYRYPSTVKDALGHHWDRTYDPGTGNILTSKDDENNLLTTYTYDGFGRKIREDRPDTTATTWSYNQCTTLCGAGTATAVSVVTTQTWLGTGQTEQTAVPHQMYTDMHDREVMTLTYDYAGGYVYQDWVFDTLARLAKTSNAQSAANRSNGHFGWTYYGNFDALNRAQLISTTKSTGSGTDDTTIDYSGQSTKTTDANGHWRTEVLNGLGKVKSVTDSLNHTTSYGYDPFGVLISTLDPSGNQNSIQVDTLGRKKMMVDLDLGTWTYVTDPAGRVEQQTDAKNVITTMTYDLLDRMTERLELDQDSHWAYDTAAHGVGKLAEAYTLIGSSKDYRRVYTYDTLGRESTQTTSLDWDYQTIDTYDTYSRLATVTHKRNTVGQNDGAQIQYTLGYNNQGDVSQVSRGTSTLWTLTAQDAQGRNTLWTLGNGWQTWDGYNVYTLRLEQIVTGADNGKGGLTQGVQGDTVGYDAVGNVTHRTWLQSTSGPNMGETLTPDELNRMHVAQVDGQTAKTFSYDAVGNLTAKPGVGSYSYPAPNTAQAHLVSSITGTVAGLTNPTLSYDNNGNLQTGVNRRLQWSAANLPVTIDRLTDGTPASAVQRRLISYGPERQRTNEVERAMTGSQYGPVQHILYMAAGIEKEIDKVNGTTTIRTYLPLGLGFTEEDFASVSIAPSAAAPANERYFHVDHLGSLEAVTDATGAVLQRFSYDPWGRRRNLNGTDTDWQSLTTTLANTLDHTGFTGEEQYDNFTLVHLNGRVYDPLIGRMTSADPTLPNPYDLQSLNRASYVLNRPLNLTDPTGFEGEDTDIQHVTVTGEACSASCQANKAAAYEDMNRRASGYGVVVGQIARASIPQLERLVAKRGAQLVLVQGCAAATGGTCEVVSLLVIAAAISDVIDIVQNASNAYDGSSGPGLGPDTKGTPDGPNGDGDRDRKRPWSSKSVRDAAKALESGKTEVQVASRAEAEELFFGRYQGQGYRNTTGMSPTEAKDFFGGKAGTYHWDIGTDNFPHEMDHLQVHTFEGDVVRIYFK
jgi:RHS repeat-associated protein